MRTLATAAVLLAFTGTALAKNPAKEEEEIRAAVKSYVEAFNKGDAKAVAAHYIEEGTTVNVFGMEMAGRATIEQELTTAFAGPLKGATIDITPTKVQMVKDVGIGDADINISGMKGPDGKPAPPIKARGIGVFVKQKGKWMFAASRAFVHLPPPPGMPKK
jgi:uncharacterized protein (TIGR02246 family)